MLKRFGDNQEAFASNSELAPTRLGMTIEEQWPALKLVGFGFYYAWIWVSYNSNVLVFPSAASDLPPDTISLTYLVSTRWRRPRPALARAPSHAAARGQQPAPHCGGGGGGRGHGGHLRIV
ncbi:MAG: hypothetical protein ACLUE1_01155 [Adlercreutzia equolifaciens]